MCADHVQPSATEESLPLRLTMDDSDSPSDVVDALFLGRFAKGEQPFARSRSVDRVRFGLTLLPPGARILRAARDEDRSATLAEGDGYTLLVSRWNRGADVTVTAVTDDLAETVLGQATDGVEDEPAPQPENVPMGFWYFSRAAGRTAPPGRSRPAPGRTSGPTTPRRWPRRWTG